MSWYSRALGTIKAQTKGGLQVSESVGVHLRCTPGAASANAIKAAFTLLAGAQAGITAGISDPDCPRNLTVAGVAAAAASAQIGAGANGMVTVTNDATGQAGNSKTIVVVVAAGANASLSAAIVGNDITVTLGTTGVAGTPDATKNTATLVAAAIDALAGVSATASGNGSTAIAGAVAQQSFTGGKNASAGDVVINGKNVNGQSFSETFALNGASTVTGTKIFAQVDSIDYPARTNTGDTVVVGRGSKLGLAHKLRHNSVRFAYLNNTVEGTPPTVTVSATVLESNGFTLNSAIPGSQPVDVYYDASGI